MSALPRLASRQTGLICVTSGLSFHLRSSQLSSRHQSRLLHHYRIVRHRSNRMLIRHAQARAASSSAVKTPRLLRQHLHYQQVQDMHHLILQLLGRPKHLTTYLKAMLTILPNRIVSACIILATHSPGMVAKAMLNRLHQRRSFIHMPTCHSAIHHEKFSRLQKLSSPMDDCRGLVPTHKHPQRLLITTELYQHCSLHSALNLPQTQRRRCFKNRKQPSLGSRTHARRSSTHKCRRNHFSILM